MRWSGIELEFFVLKIRNLNHLVFFFLAQNMEPKLPRIYFLVEIQNPNYLLLWHHTLYFFFVPRSGALIIVYYFLCPDPEPERSSTFRDLGSQLWCLFYKILSKILQNIATFQGWDAILSLSYLRLILLSNLLSIVSVLSSWLVQLICT